VCLDGETQPDEDMAFQKAYPGFTVGETCEAVPASGY
jgi:hypothetical protein